MSQPRGRKSRPTKASSTLDLPLLWLPTTATCGSEISESSAPTGDRMSWSLFMIGITDAPIVGGVSIAFASSPIDFRRDRKKKNKNPKRERVKGFIIYIESRCCDRYGDKVLGEEVRKSGFCFCFFLLGEIS
ncbi:hypothetical protein ACB098_01G095500 [Castanea mollissima]